MLGALAAPNNAGSCSKNRRYVLCSGWPSIRAIASLCRFHYLREAAEPVYEADRHAKVQLKKTVRGNRPIERKVQGRQDGEAEAIQGHCAAVRSALTDDGRPPLEASGVKLRDRLAEVAASLDRVGVKRGPRRS